MPLYRSILILSLITVFIFAPQVAAAETDTYYIPVVQNNLYGYIEKNGTMVIKPQFDYAGSFFEGQAAVRTTDGKWGYIDKSGAFTIEPAYGHASHFGQGYGLVEKDGKFIFIKKNGETAFKTQFDGGGSFNDELANVLVNDKWGYIGTNGQFVIAPQFDGAEDFHEGLARVCFAPEGGNCTRSDGKKFGFIDKSGKLIIPAKFDYAEHFSEGLAMARIEDMYGFVDKSGQWLIAPFYTDAGMAFSEGLARVNTKDGTSVLSTPPEKLFCSRRKGLTWAINSRMGWSWRWSRQPENGDIWTNRAT